MPKLKLDDVDFCELPEDLSESLKELLKTHKFLFTVWDSFSGANSAPEFTLKFSAAKIMEPKNRMNMQETIKFTEDILWYKFYPYLTFSLNEKLKSDIIDTASTVLQTLWSTDQTTVNPKKVNIQIYKITKDKISLIFFDRSIELEY